MTLACYCSQVFFSLLLVKLSAALNTTLHRARCRISYIMKKAVVITYGFIMFFLRLCRSIIFSKAVCQRLFIVGIYPYFKALFWLLTLVFLLLKRFACTHNILTWLLQLGHFSFGKTYCLQCKRIWQ